MRIVIDMQGAQSASRARGIGRYSLSFTKALVRNGGGHEILLALNDGFPETVQAIRSAFAGLLPAENIRVWCAPWPVREIDTGNEMRRLHAETIREAFLASLNPDIVHLTSLFEGYDDDAVTSIGAFVSDIPTSVTLHDLIPLHEPRRFLDGNSAPALANWYYRKLDFLRKSDLLLAVSQASARDAHHSLSISNNKIVNVSAACSENFRPITISGSEERALYSRLRLESRSFSLRERLNRIRTFRACFVRLRVCRRRFEITMPLSLLAMMSLRNR